MELTGKKYGSGGGSLRKLLSTRQGTALVAGVCTLVAAGVLLFAASRYRHSVDVGSQPETVLVASSLIQKGTPGDVISRNDLFRPQKIMTKQVSAGAVVNTAAIHGKVAATDIQPGQQLTLSDFKASDGYVSDLAPNERAMSIALDTSHGLTGVLQAGDRVDVYAGLSAVGGRSATSGNGSDAALGLLIPNVPVLAVDQNSGAGGVAGSSVNTQADVVLKVKAADAGALALAADNGKVWLVLRGANATEPGAQTHALYTINSLLLGSKGGGR